MTDADTPLPPEDEPTEEETQAANALREALEGRRAGTHLPEPALETAALLRFSGAAGRLSEERSAALRAELMAALPAASAGKSKARKGLRHWLGLGLTLAGGVTAVVVIGVIGARQLSAPAAREEARFSDERYATASPSAPAREAPAVTESPAAAPSPAAEPLRLAANSDSAKEESQGSAPAARADSPRAEAEPRRARSAAKGDAADKQASAERAASGAGAPGGGGALALRRMAPAPAEAHDDESAGAALAAAAAPTASGPIAEAKKTAPAAPVAVPTEQVRRESDRYRAQLLAELADPKLNGAYSEVDRAQSAEELERARQRLSSLASSSFGGRKANAERLRPDIYCRLAEVALRLGQPQAALDWARRGLALDAPASPFVARLYLLEGQAKSALGDRNGAAKSYLKAIEVNEQLLDQSLDSAE